MITSLYEAYEFHLKMLKKNLLENALLANFSKCFYLFATIIFYDFIRVVSLEGLIICSNEFSLA